MKTQENRRSSKLYHCKECGAESYQNTNHYGETYGIGSFNECQKCPPFKRPTVWVCAEKPPIDTDTLKVADGVAKALMRDELDRGEKLDRALDDLEAVLYAKIHASIEQIRTKLIHAVTDYDRSQSKRAGYNPYALGRYMMAVDEVCTDMKSGVTARDAINSAFNDRLADKLLKAVGLPTN